MRADTGDFHHREFWRESCASSRFVKGLRECGRWNFSDRAASLANQECDDRRLVVIVGAGKKRIAAFDAVDKTVFHQEVERAVDRNRRRTRHVLGEMLDNLVGSKRTMAREQRFQNLASDRREFLPAARTNPLGMRERILGASGVVMIWCRENGLQFFHSETI